MTDYQAPERTDHTCDGVTDDVPILVGSPFVTVDRSTPTPVLMRNCGGPGTFDSGNAAQVGTRDAEIFASPFACEEPVCGDSVCEDGEDCFSCEFDCGC